MTTMNGCLATTSEKLPASSVRTASPSSTAASASAKEGPERKKMLARRVNGSNREMAIA